MEEARVKKLEINNILRIDYAVIEPNESQSTIIINGNNEQGKSSIISSIFLACLDSDAKSQLGLSEIVKKGNETGSIKLELSNGIVIERDYESTGGMTLKVYNNGEKVKKAPQQFINEIISKISIDPSVFINMNNEERVKALVSLTDYDFKTHNTIYKKLYEERLGLGQEKRFAEKSKDELECEKVDRIDLSSMHKTINDAIVHNSMIDKHYEAQAEIDKLNKIIPTLTTLSAGLSISESTYTELFETFPDIKGSFSVFKNNVISKTASSHERMAILQQSLIFDKNALNKIDIEKIQLDVKSYEETNEKANSYERYMSAIDRFNTAQANWSQKDKEIIELNAKLVNSINLLDIGNVSLVYEGSNGFPTLHINDIPFSQCSESQKLMFSLKIACMSAKGLKVIRIADASLFDNDRLSKIEKIAKELNFQVWLERVGYGYVTISENGTMGAKPYENGVSVFDGKIIQS